MDSTNGVADLHMHTVSSDGTCSIDDRVYQARERNLDAIAITDHDCVSTEIEDRQAADDGLELIAGVEIRADVQDTKVELLGYFVDPNDEQLTDILAKVREYRRDRNRKIIQRLRKTTSLDQPYEDIRGKATGILGRPHIANVLVEEGIVDSIGAAFDKYLATDGTAFVPMERVPAPEVIDAIQGAGGVVSLAHPGRIRAESIDDIVDELVEAELDAIEVQYPYDAAPTEGYADVSVEDAAALAEKYWLLQTGGSDCHGPESGKFRIGEIRVSDSQLDALRERADRRRSL
jgi:predicted metal-dependent phosphoesterase TrpH